MDTKVKMDLFGGGLYIPVRLWSKAERKYRWISLTLDTGATVTTMSPEIFHELGYEPSTVGKTKITTASGIEYVDYFILDAIKIGDIELKNITSYALKFPEESFSMGVIGLNVLRLFDMELLFSQKVISLKKLQNI